MSAITMHTFSQSKSWPEYHAAYLRWMQSINHPDLAKSNYNAATWKERNVNKPIPVLDEIESKNRWPS